MRFHPPRGKAARSSAAVLCAAVLVMAGTSCELILGPAVEIETIIGKGAGSISFTRVNGSSGTLDQTWPTTVYTEEFPLTLGLASDSGWRVSEIIVDNTIHSLNGGSFTLERAMFSGDNPHSVILVSVPQAETIPEYRAPLLKTDGYLFIGEGSTPNMRKIAYTRNGTTETLVEKTYGIFNVAAGDSVFGIDSSVGSFAFEDAFSQTEYWSFSNPATVVFANALEPTLATASGHIVYRNSFGELFVNTVENDDIHQILAQSDAAYYRPSINDQNQGYRILAVYKKVAGDGLYAELYAFNLSVGEGFSLQQLRSVRIGESNDEPLPVVWDPTRIFAVFSAHSGDDYYAMGLVPYPIANNHGTGRWWSVVFEDLKFSTVHVLDSFTLNRIPLFDPEGLGKAAYPTLNTAKPYVWFPWETSPDSL